MGNLANKLLSSHARSTNSDMPPWLLVILEYSDWDVRLKLVLLSKQWRNNTQTAAYHRFLCSRLAEERAIYVPRSLPSRLDWRTLFSHLYPLRDIWNAGDEASRESAENVHKETWKIQVFARFRPMDQRGEEDEQECASVTLPLHQRLAIIRRRHRLQGNQSALKVLAQEGGWFQSKWKEIADDTTEGIEDKENLVNSSSSGGATAFYTKMQPQLSKKMRDGLARGADANKIVSKVMSCDALTGSVVMMTPDSGLREFLFDGVMPASTSQRSAYDMAVKPLVMDLLNGFNATAVVYGQTGAGKTYSMFGETGQTSSSSSADLRGFLPRACEEIFQAITQRNERHGIISTLRVSYVEVYGDQVSDLLRFGARCGHSKVAAQRYVLNGAAEMDVSSLQDLRSVLQQGEAQKRRAATAMNDRSTRAHTVFILSLAQQMPSSTNQSSTSSAPRALTSRLFLADLGGSEQVKKSQVAGQHLQEAVYINLGLLALKKVAEALQAGAARHVPYQDAKLTMLLSEGLGGNSKTSIIVCGALNPAHAVETLATLRFGETCRKVETRARKNASCVAGVLDALDAEIGNLEAIILRKERWEVQERRREDRLAEEGTWEHAVGGLEVMKVSVVVGAEAERRQLERLLRQRAALIGSEPLHSEEDEDQEDGVEKKEDEPRKRVVGFGKQYAEAYGFGAGFDETAEASQENSRFTAATDQRDLPAVLRAKKSVAASWAQGQVQSEEDVRRTAAKANKKRNKLAYSGISA